MSGVAKNRNEKLEADGERERERERESDRTRGRGRARNGTSRTNSATDGVFIKKKRICTTYNHIHTFIRFRMLSPKHIFEHAKYLFALTLSQSLAPNSYLSIKVFWRGREREREGARGHTYCTTTARSSYNRIFYAFSKTTKMEIRIFIQYSNSQPTCMRIATTTVILLSKKLSIYRCVPTKRTISIRLKSQRENHSNHLLTTIFRGRIDVIDTLARWFHFIVNFVFSSLRQRWLKSIMHFTCRMYGTVQLNQFQLHSLIGKSQNYVKHDEVTTTATTAANDKCQLTTTKPSKHNPIKVLFNWYVVWCFGFVVDNQKHASTIASVRASI